MRVIGVWCCNTAKWKQLISPRAALLICSSGRGLAGFGLGGAEAVVEGEADLLEDLRDDLHDAHAEHLRLRQAHARDGGGLGEDRAGGRQQAAGLGHEVDGQCRGQGCGQETLVTQRSTTTLSTKALACRDHRRTELRAYPSLRWRRHCSRQPVNRRSCF